MGSELLCTIAYPFGIDPKAQGVHVFAYDADVDTTADLITTAAFVQLAAEDSLEAISADSRDITQSITVVGVLSNGKRSHTTKALTGDAAVTLDGTWRYVENCYLDKECVGAITLRQATGDTFINSIAIGSLSADVVQHFSGDDFYPLILGWWAGTPFTQDQGIFYELRWYPDDADCLDAATGYRLLDRIDVDTDESAVGPGSIMRKFPAPIRLSPGGWICVYGDSEGDNQVGYAGFQIIDVPFVT